MGAQGSFWLSLFTKEHLRGSIFSWIRADLEGCCSVTELSRLILALLKVPVLAPAESCCLIHQGCQWLEQLGCCWEDASDPGTLKYLPWRVESDTLESKCACARFTCRCCWCSLAKNWLLGELMASPAFCKHLNTSRKWYMCSFSVPELIGIWSR